MVLGCRGPRRQGRTSSSVYVTPVTAAPCGCTPDCLQPITHRSSRDSCHFPFLRVRKRVARLPIPPSPHCALQLADPPPPHLPTTPLVTTSSSSRSRWRNNRLQRRATHNHHPLPLPPLPGVGFPTQATGQPQPSLSLESPQPATRAASARPDVAKSEQPSTLLVFFFFSFSFFLVPSLPSLVPFHPSFYFYSSLFASPCCKVRLLFDERVSQPGVHQPASGEPVGQRLSFSESIR